MGRHDASRRRVVELVAGGTPGHIALLAPPTWDQEVRCQSGWWRGGRGRRRRSHGGARMEWRPRPRRCRRRMPRATLTSRGVRRHRGEEGGVDEPAGPSVSGTTTDDDIGVRQQAAGLEIGCTPVPGAAGDAGPRRPEGASRRRRPRPRRRTPGSARACRRWAGASPGATGAGPITHETGDAAQARQHEGDRELGGRGVVDAPPVAEQGRRRATRPRTLSTPAVRVCTTSRLVMRSR